jgi:hypothetical protein
MLTDFLWQAVAEVLADIQPMAELGVMLRLQEEVAAGQAEAGRAAVDLLLAVIVAAAVAV